MHREGHRNTQGRTQKCTGRDIETHRGDTVMHNFDLWDTHRTDIRTDRGSYIGGAHLKKGVSL